MKFDKNRFSDTVTPHKTITHNMHNKALLLGNGINLLDQNNEDKKSWGDVLDDLGKEFDWKNSNLKDHVPLPIAFESIYCQKIRKHKETKEIDLKREVQESLSQLGPNKYHEKIANLGYQHILTSNYDYNLETAFETKPDNQREKNHTRRETKFSLGRRYKLSESQVWHIHGELNVTNSIMLGHDHYSSYHSKIREELIKGGISERIEKLKNWKKNSAEATWMDIFLSHDIDILGFGFDFSEYILWWLLEYRAKLKYCHKAKLNEITFHSITGPKCQTPSQLARNELFQSFGVKVIKYDNAEWESSYDEFIQRQTTTPKKSWLPSYRLHTAKAAITALHHEANVSNSGYK